MKKKQAVTIVRASNLNIAVAFEVSPCPETQFEAGDGHELRMHKQGGARGAQLLHFMTTCIF